MKKLLHTILLLSLAAIPSRSQEGITKSPTSFQGIAHYKTLNTKTKNFKAHTVYPVFRVSTPLTRFANAQIRDTQRGAYLQWVAETKKSFLGDSKPFLPCEYQSEPSLSYFVPSHIISLSFESYEFGGGAHGIDLSRANNFVLLNGRPKRLVLGDLFDPKTDYRALVERQIFAKLKKNPDPAWVQDGSVKTLDNNQFNNFLVGSNGLTWTFNPYEMGPFASGQFEVKLSFAELGPHFKRALLGMR